MKGRKIGRNKEVRWVFNYSPGWGPARVAPSSNCLPSSLTSSGWMNSVMLRSSIHACKHTKHQYVHKQGLSVCKHSVMLSSSILACQHIKHQYVHKQGLSVCKHSLMLLRKRTSNNTNHLYYCNISGWMNSVMLRSSIHACQHTTQKYF
jgi:hypothetical protein